MSGYAGAVVDCGVRVLLPLCRAHLGPDARLAPLYGPPQVRDPVLEGDAEKCFSLCRAAHRFEASEVSCARESVAKLGQSVRPAPIFVFDIALSHPSSHPPTYPHTHFLSLGAATQYVSARAAAQHSDGRTRTRAGDERQDARDVPPPVQHTFNHPSPPTHTHVHTYPRPLAPCFSCYPGRRPNT